MITMKATSKVTTKRLRPATPATHATRDAEARRLLQAWQAVKERTDRAFDVWDALHDAGASREQKRAADERADDLFREQMEIEGRICALALDALGMEPPADNQTKLAVAIDGWVFVIGLGDAPGKTVCEVVSPPESVLIIG